MDGFQGRNLKMDDNWEYPHLWKPQIHGSVGKSENWGIATITTSHPIGGQKVAKTICGAAVFCSDSWALELQSERRGLERELGVPKGGPDEPALVFFFMIPEKHKKTSKKHQQHHKFDINSGFSPEFFMGFPCKSPWIPLQQATTCRPGLVVFHTLGVWLSRWEAWRMAVRTGKWCEFPMAFTHPRSTVEERLCQGKTPLMSCSVRKSTFFRSTDCHIGRMRRSSAPSWIFCEAGGVPVNSVDLFSFLLLEVFSWRTWSFKSLASENSCPNGRFMMVLMHNQPWVPGCFRCFNRGFPCKV